MNRYSHSFFNVSYTCYKSLLIGFVWQHIAPLPLKGTDWELTNLNSIGINLRDPASCITELAKKEIPRTMHVFFRDYQISYPKCAKLNEEDLPTSCNDSRPFVPGNAGGAFGSLPPNNTATLGLPDLPTGLNDKNNGKGQGNLLRGIANWQSAA